MQFSLEPAINFLNEEIESATFKSRGRLFHSLRRCTLEIVLGIRSLGLAELDLCNCSANYMNFELHFFY